MPVMNRDRACFAAASAAAFAAALLTSAHAEDDGTIAGRVVEQDGSIRQMAIDADSWVIEKAWFVNAVDLATYGRLQGRTVHQTSIWWVLLPKGRLVRIVDSDSNKIIAGGPVVLNAECLALVSPNVSGLTQRFGGVPKCFWTYAGMTEPAKPGPHP